ncbi:unnamed protein product [Psylliodes chrysocephalus]|uniref:Uncharacterized protein n=1 Tax=Psylliodes chrysocephalus TaxID=3402493 RepID=A0A9P0GJ10_9CUCU|nr:unnamed protein product [Psylliodes chrysocephala]
MALKFKNEVISGNEEEDISSTHEQEQDFHSDESIRDRDYFPSDESTDDERETLKINKGPDFIEVRAERVDESDQKVTERVSKKLVRKRMRNPESWEKNKRKKNRNSGQVYTTVNGKSVAKRRMGVTCSEKCRIKCSSKVNDNERQRIFDFYWKLGDINLQRNFVNTCMSEINPTYRNSKPGSKRSKNYKYSFVIDNVSIQVCKTFFKNTLGINNRTIFTTTKKNDQQGTIELDQRGKHTQHKRIPKNIRSDIMRHIDSFPRVSSHYCRTRTNKKYLEGSLKIRIMHRLYVQQCEDTGIDFAKYGTYAHIFNTETNIAFHMPKKDQCTLCENYKNATEESKANIREKYENHLKEKDQSRLEKIRDVENPNICVYSYDLQAVLPTPCGDVNAFYYKSKLSTLNFTIFDLKDKKGYCYLWHEAIAKRGANEISSCVYKFIADHKERDMEKRRVLKSGPIYIPAQWAMIIRSAKKQGHPYKLEEISTNDILDFKKFISKIGNNFNKNENNEPVVWKDVKIVRFEKEHPYTIFYKTSYAESNFKQIYVKKKNVRCKTDISSLEITRAYTNPPTISVKKKKNLLEMCRENVIPVVHWPFYENLQESNVNSEAASDDEEI